MSGADARALARRLVVGLEGTWPKRREVEWLRSWRPAGVILFARNVADDRQLADLCRLLHGLDPGLEVVADHEGGPVSQLEAALGRPPAPWTLGALDLPDLTRRCHEETAARCAAVGIDRVLAPCCDVLVEAENPVIGSRAFGAAEDLVGRHVAAAVAGLRAGGVAVCAKHWPGHGGSRTDSHLGLARVGAGARSAPFRAAVEAGADAVMIGHLLPENDDPGRPASLDPRAVGAARELAAPGTISTYADDITMGALRDFLGGEAGAAGSDAFAAGMLDPAHLAPEWIRSVADGGCDRLLIRGIPWTAFPVDVEDPERVVPRHQGPGPALPTATCAEQADMQLLRRAGVREFRATDAELLWLDPSTGDRWNGTAGESTRRRLSAWLENRFARVVRCTGLPAPERETGAVRSHLLVTSHRPLTAPLPTDWAAGGRALVMGHPSLAGTVRRSVGPGWRVSALYDITARACSV